MDGNGWYDGTDAYFVKLVVSGMVSANALTEAQRMACDVNHDGVIDALDVATLEQAGLLLANVDQSAPSEELQANSDYQAYCSLIDQNIEVNEPESEQPTTPDEPEQPSSNVWQVIINLFKRIMSFVLAIFSAGVITK